MVPIPAHFGPLTQSWRQGAEMGAGVKAWCHPFITQEMGACCSQVMSFAALTGEKYEKIDPREWHLRTEMAPDGIAETAAPFHFMGQDREHKWNPERAPPLYIYIYLLHTNTTAEGEVWPEGSRSAWGTRAALAAQRAQAEHTGAHRSQAQHCPIHTGCRCEEQLLTAGAGEWVKTLLAGGKMMGKETFPSMSLLWQEGSCSGDFTGIPPWGQKHFRVN